MPPRIWFNSLLSMFSNREPMANCANDACVAIALV
jgi:hypothetical protein